MKTENPEWSWVEAIKKDPSKRGVSVAAFEHVPLGGHEWHKLFPLGVTGEYVYRGKVEHRTTEQPKHKAKYWFVKVVDTCGYYVQIEYLGYPEEHVDKVVEARRWVMYTQLKPICTYTEHPACGLAAPINVDMPMEETLNFIYAQMIGKLGVPALADKFLDHKLSSEIKMGQRVEIRDISCVNQVVIGFVGKIVGCRVCVIKWDAKGQTRKQSESFWGHESFKSIHPLGWAAAAGVPNAPPSGPDDKSLIPEELGVDLSSPAIATIKEDAYFEMVNPLDYNNIVAAKVRRVLNHGFFLCEIVSDIHQDSFDKYSGGENQFHLHITSKLIMACGTSQKQGASILPPKDGPMRAFDWDRYLAVNGAEALEVPDKKDNERYDHLQKGLRVEAVDHVKPSLICPAVIVQVIRPHLIKVRYLGWTSEYDQWKPIDYPEIYPAGWCTLVGYPLTKPGANTVFFEHDATFDFVPPPVPTPLTPPPPKPKNRKASAILQRRGVPVHDGAFLDFDSESKDDKELSTLPGKGEAAKRAAETSPALRRKSLKPTDADTDYKPSASITGTAVNRQRRSKSVERELVQSPKVAEDFKKETTTAVPARPQPCSKSGEAAIADSKNRLIFSYNYKINKNIITLKKKPKPMEVETGAKTNGTSGNGSKIPAPPLIVEHNPSTVIHEVPTTSTTAFRQRSPRRTRTRKQTLFFGENLGHEEIQFT